MRKLNNILQKQRRPTQELHRANVRIMRRYRQALRLHHATTRLHFHQCCVCFH